MAYSGLGWRGFAGNPKTVAPFTPTKKKPEPQKTVSNFAGSGNPPAPNKRTSGFGHGGGTRRVPEIKRGGAAPAASVAKKAGRDSSSFGHGGGTRRVPETRRGGAAGQHKSIYASTDTPAASPAKKAKPSSSKSTPSRSTSKKQTSYQKFQARVAKRIDRGGGGRNN